MSDITEQEQTVEALRQSQERLARAQQIGHLGHWDWDIQGQTLMWSDEVYRIFGVDRTFPLTYETIEAMIHPDDRSRNSRYIQKLLAAGDKIEFEFRIIRPQGEIRYIVQTAQVERDEAGQPLRIFGIMQDITERRRTEQALRHSQSELEAVYKHAPVMMCLLGPHREVLYANRAFTAFTGISEAELVQGRACGVFGCINAYEHPDGCGSGVSCRDCRLRLAIEDTLATGQGHRDVEYRATLERAGVRRDVVLVGATARIESGESLRVLLCLEDITEHKRAEDALRESENLYAQTMDSISDAVFLVDDQGKFVYVCPNVNLSFGFSADEVRALGNLRALVGNEPYIPDALDHELRNIEWHITDKSGHPRTLLANIKPVQIKNATHLYVCRDVTERKQAEEALKQSREQLRALASYLHTTQEKERARVAREVHDEFGQSLTALKIDLAWLAKRLPPDEPVLANKVEDMITLVDSTIQIMRRVATELRPGLLDDLGLVAALEWQAQEFAGRTGIVCQVDLGQEALAQALLTLDQDLATAIFRIFQEALTNIARHAEATQVQVALQQVQNVLILTVRDNGKGMPPNVAADPRALGLLGMRERAIVWQGSVTFESAPGHGTTVTLRVPYLAGKEASQ